jgi:uncharacterized protein (TIGR02996 family)
VDEGLLQAIRERPEDDGPRLVLADWLSERGDPRGELIVLQCRLARMDRDDDERRWMEARMRELLAEHEQAWRGRVLALPTVSLGYLERGFVRRVAMAESAFAKRAAELLAEAPLLEEVYLSRDREPADLAVPPELAQLRGVRVDSTRFAHAVLASPHATQLEMLAFGGQAAGPEIAERIASAGFERLKRLDLDGTGIGNAGLERLGRWPGLAKLERLELARCNLGPGKPLGAFVASDALHGLRWLTLRSNPLRAAGVAAVLKSPALRAVEHLDLGDTDASGLAQLALPAIRELRWNRNLVTKADGAAFAQLASSVERLELCGSNDEARPCVAADAAIAIVSSTALPRLTVLDLQQNRFRRRAADVFAAIRPGFCELRLGYVMFDHEGARALAENPHVASLRTIDLGNNPLFPASVEHLAASAHLRPHVLDLRYCELGTAGVAALAASPILSEVRTLELNGNKLDDDAARALAASPHLGKLVRLLLYGNRLTDAGATALATLPPLVELALGGNDDVTGAAITALRAAGHGARA